MALTDASNILLLHTTTTKLYETICEQAVRNFGLKMAWLGLVVKGSYDVKPAGQYGFDEGYLENIRITWDDSLTGMGPTGMAIKTKTAQVVDDTEIDARFAPWREEALKRGFRSVLAAPMINSIGEIIGSINLYIEEAYFFTSQHKKLFQIFANQAATAIENNLLVEGLEQKVRERTQALSKANVELKKLFNAIEQSDESILITDINGTIQYVNPAFTTKTGFSREEAIGSNPRILQSGLTSRELYDDLWATIRSGKSWKGTLINKKKSGELFYEDATIAPVVDEEGGMVGFVAAKTDVTNRIMFEEELKRKNAELNEARAVAEFANKAKSEFLANMSHELRTPLNSVIGFSQIMLDGLGGPLSVQQKEYTNDIFESGHLLLSLINDILDLSKIEAGKMVLEYSEVNIPEIIERSLVFFKEKALKHNIRMMSEIKGETVVLEADERKLMQVLVNLLSNAVKFTPDGGSISAHAEREGEYIKFSVEDTGYGIKEEDIPKLFQPFNQLESPYGKKYLGTGLGLALCKEIVELHGGRIWVESEFGKGSRFVFTIPR